MLNYVIINEKDNVGLALTALAEGTVIEAGNKAITLRNDIPAAHKFALQDIECGASIIKYGSVIGHASCSIKTGEWVHLHNLATNLSGIVEYSYSGCKAPAISPHRNDTFLGYRRKDGKAGTRNELWIIPTVACVNHTCEAIAEAARKLFPDACDGIYALPHNSGCSQIGEGAEITEQLLKGIVLHPNAGGVLLVSLGCENNSLKVFLPILGNYDKSRIRYIITQDIPGDEVEYGLEVVKEILAEMKSDKRVEIPASELTIGLKCGGSDAFSGITANPLAGRIADKAVENGGSCILSEVSEMFGAEQALMDRAADKETYEKSVELINAFKQYYMDFNLPIYENPSPGNKDGGLSTDEEKSLGNIQKSGKYAVTDVLQYGQTVTKPGVNLLNGPGNDSVSITCLLASGAQILLFTTGRGNPLSSMVPTVKIASNTSLAERKQTWIDFNAGRILNGDTFDNLSDELWNFVLDVASGKAKTKSEIADFRGIMIFKKGVLL